MAKTKQKEGSRRMLIACPFCDEPATVKQCQGDGRGAAGQDYYWRCGCSARGFFPERHFKQLDKLKKISFS